jgi:predicted membrane chloride channel (bestrophin family)
VSTFWGEHHSLAETLQPGRKVIMKKLRQMIIIINLKTIVVTALAVFSTYLCRRFEITAEFPMTLIAIAVVFPIVFSIGGAYKRRENALTKYSSIKAHGRAIYFASRDWIEDTDDEIQSRAKDLLGELLVACRTLFAHPVAEMSEHEEKVYKLFSRLSTYIKEDFRGRGMPSGEVSRCNQFLSKMIIAFEDVKHIYQYRTPRTLRAFSDFFVTVLPVLYGPYFAAIAQDYSGGLAYVMPVLFTIILVSLDNIQDHLENPFDQIGEDDIAINAEKFVRRLDLK